MFRLLRRRRRRRTKNVTSRNVEIDTTNLYTILELKDLSFRSSQKDIKRAYRKAILIHHPDKKVGGGKQEEDPCF